jgi:hypothetical protein
MLWDSIISTRLDFYFVGREGDGCMKDTDHPIRHPHVHLDNRASAEGTRACARRDDSFGRGQNTVLGWSDPTFAHGSVAKVMLGVAPAQPKGQIAACYACVRCGSSYARQAEQFFR